MDTNTSGDELLTKVMHETDCPGFFYFVWMNICDLFFIKLNRQESRILLQSSGNDGQRMSMIGFLKP